jgi:hypothetical protein
MNNSNVGASLGEAATLLTNLVGHSAKVGLSILGALGTVPEKLLCEVSQGRGIIGGCDCDIPSPCWEPQSLGEVTSFVAPGGQATMRFRITNSSFSSRIINFLASPAASVTFSENPVTLAPLQRHVVSAFLQVPANAKQGTEQEVVIFVRGCRNYYVRWTVKVMDCGATMCNEVELDDGPDLIHHWYDHFYCRRECQDQRTHP